MRIACALVQMRSGDYHQATLDSAAALEADWFAGRTFHVIAGTVGQRIPVKLAEVESVSFYTSEVVARQNEIEARQEADARRQRLFGDGDDGGE